MESKLSAHDILAHLRRNLPMAQTDLSAYTAEVRVQIYTGKEWVAPIEDVRNVLALDKLIEEVLGAVSSSD